VKSFVKAFLLPFLDFKHLFKIFHVITGI